MMIALRLICFVALVMSLTTDSGSRPPQQIENPQTSSDHSEETKPDQSGTEQSPFIVKVVPPQETNPPGDKRAEGVEKSTEDRIADYTLALTVLTGFLVVATAGLVRVGYRQETHFRLIERAWLFAGPNPKQVQAVQDVRTFQLGINNYGKTPGFLKELYWDEVAEEPLSADVQYSGGAQHKLDIVFAAGEIGKLHQYFFSVRVRKYFVGYIIYEDIFKKRHTSRFCLRVGAKQFESAGHAAWSEQD